MKAKLGCQLPHGTADFEKLVSIAKECENLGYDSIWTYDHLSPFWTKSHSSLECWTVLSGIAERTNEIKIGSLVTNVNFRNPALLAKMSSTVDNISEGRLILGLGIGDSLSRHELSSNGYLFPNLAERVDRLKETILILRAMWREDEPFFHGKYSSLAGALNYPKPNRSAQPPLWIGGKHPMILDLVAEMADGWNYWGLSKEELKRRTRHLSSRCSALNRPIATITKSWSGTLARLARGNENRPQILHRMVEELRSQTDIETDYFIASFGMRADHKSYEVFAQAVRDLY